MIDSSNAPTSEYLRCAKTNDIYDCAPCAAGEFFKRLRELQRLVIERANCCSYEIFVKGPDDLTFFGERREYNAEVELK